MYYDSEARAGSGEPGLPFNPFKALVAPRPIGWVTTLSAAGTVNLAPYSYFQAVADSPDIVMFSATPALAPSDSSLAASGGGPRFGTGRKDSESNAIATGEFVCNLVSYDLRQAMNETSAHLPSDESEVPRSGLEMASSTRVKPPRVAAAPASLECVFTESLPVMHRGGEHRYRMVFGEVVGIHINDEFIRDGKVDTAAMQILTRMGYDEYAVLEKTFSMARPDNDPMLSGLLKR